MWVTLFRTKSWQRILRRIRLLGHLSPFTCDGGEHGDERPQQPPDHDPVALRQQRQGARATSMVGFPTHEQDFPATQVTGVTFNVPVRG